MKEKVRKYGKTAREIEVEQAEKKLKKYHQQKKYKFKIPIVGGFYLTNNKRTKKEIESYNDQKVYRR